jgi:hypothetical protein
LSDDRTKIRVDFPSDPPISLEYDPEQLDDMIAGLAQMRAAMEPPVPMADPDPNTRILVAENGRFYVQPDKQGQGTTLALLHPGFRWVGMFFTREGIAELLAALQKYAVK